MNREEQAEKNRAMFPWAAGIVDDLRAEFGPGVKLTFVQENGHTLGKKFEGGVVPVIDKPAHVIMNRGQKRHER